jgi:hypothetical protein
MQKIIRFKIKPIKINLFGKRKRRKKGSLPQNSQKKIIICHSQNSSKNTRQRRDKAQEGRSGSAAQDQEKQGVLTASAFR